MKINTTHVSTTCGLSMGIALAIALALTLLGPASPAPAQVPAAADPGQNAPRAGGAAPVAMFNEPAQPRALPQLDAYYLPLRQVQIDVQRLAQAIIGSRLTFDLEPGIAAIGLVNRVVRHSDTCAVVAGTIGDPVEGEFVFAIYGDAVAMRLSLPGRDRLYSVRLLGDEVYLLSRIDESQLPPCEGSLPAPPAPPRVLAPDDDDFVPPGAEASGEPRFGGGCGGSTPMLDHMVVYTPAARTAAGGTNAIRAIAVLAVDQTSESYGNSACTARARLVYCDEISYTESGSLNTDLSRLTGTSDGFMDGVHAIRDNVNADLVALYGNSGSGLGWCNSDYGGGFSTLKWDRASSDFTHAHETGHNMGCAHDTANVDCDPTPPYGYGWRFTGTNMIQYRTVMAYPPGTVIKYFSNPSVSFQGTATGTATAHNARVINDRDTVVEAFERTRFDIYVNFAYAGTEMGTFSQPYNTLPEGVTNIAVPAAGAPEHPNLYVRNGTTTFTGTISKKMKIQACNGVVRIGG